MVGADGVDKRALDVRTGFFCRFHGAFQVTNIIECVKYADDANAVVYRAMHKFAHHVVSVVVIAENVLSAQEHLDRSLGQVFAKGTQSLPGILVQKPQTAVESSTAPCFECVIHNLIQLL